MNWVEFLTDNSIEYVTRSSNTKRGEISIRCPFCGEDDPSQHLGISLTTENWGCLRNPAHRGHSPAHLVGGILGVSAHQARLIVGQYSESDPESLGVVLEWGTSMGVNQPKPKVHEQRPDLKQIKSFGSTGRFWHYLTMRGFDPHRVIHDYGLKCCVTGHFKDRIIIPVYRQGEIIAWTGRSLINPVTAPRYLSSKRIKETVLNEDVLLGLGGTVLFVTEGPFDAMKLDHYGSGHAARATCTFGTGVSADQAVLLSSMRHRFKKVVVLYDQGALEPALQVMDWINGPNVILGQLPEGVKDPGSMDEDQIHQLIQEIS